jgi:hypothetical protein
MLDPPNLTNKIRFPIDPLVQTRDEKSGAVFDFIVFATFFRLP